MANTAELTKTLKAIFQELFPDLNGYHYPIKAKVVAVHEQGGKVTDFQKLYSVDVQPLKPDGTIDDTQPVIPDVELPVVWAGPQRGIFCLPVKGAVVRLGYYYNDPSYPFVDAILADGFPVPDHPVGAFIIQQSASTSIEITSDGIIFTKSNGKRINLLSHTHPTPHGESGPPSAS